MKKQMERIAKEIYPKIPRSVEEIHTTFQSEEIKKKYGYTLNGKYELFVDVIAAKEYAFCLFASSVTLQIIRQHISPENRCYVIDGTFKIVPSMFTQLLIIAIEFKSDVGLTYNVYYTG